MKASNNRRRPLTPEQVAQETIRPAWTHNNVGLFLYWMRTGQCPPDGWIDPGDSTNVFEASESRRDHRTVSSQVTKNTAKTGWEA